MARAQLRETSWTYAVECLVTDEVHKYEGLRLPASGSDRRGPMSRSETDIPPADLSVSPEPDVADASRSGRVIMIQRSRKDSLDSRDLPGQPSHSNIDKVP